MDKPIKVAKSAKSVKAVAKMKEAKKPVGRPAGKTVPNQPKPSKAPEDPKQPKQPKQPKVPKAPKEPKQPKQPKASATSKDIYSYFTNIIKAAHNKMGAQSRNRIMVVFKDGNKFIYMSIIDQKIMFSVDGKSYDVNFNLETCRNTPAFKAHVEAVMKACIAYKFDLVKSTKTFDSSLVSMIFEEPTNLIECDPPAIPYGPAPPV